ncbi:MAG: hypothetical protein LC107_05910 [Chitinophagales bacterium]|nr:hypothetical protein [Chitinophagales bacterium]
MKNIWTVIGFVFLVMTHWSCEKDKDEVYAGMRPVYLSYDNTEVIQTEPARPFGTLGNIVSVGDWLLVNEQNNGIHVIDNKDPEHPENLFFWYIPGNRSFTIRQNILYADNGKHLLVIDISAPEQIKVVHIIRDQYEIQEAELYPIGYKGYFECYYPEKGILLGWEMVDRLVNPNCRTS